MKQFILYVCFVIFVTNCNDVQKVNSSNPKQSDVNLTTKPENLFNGDNLFIVEKNYTKETNGAILDLYYPELNESHDIKYKVFNNFVKSNIIKPIIDEVFVEGELSKLCDTATIHKLRSLMNYSIMQNDNVLSVVFIIEHYYNDASKSNLSFKTLIFDIEDYKIITFDNYFKEEYKSQILEIINSVINNNINSGEMYYDCWEVSEYDFNNYKDNFCLENDSIRFYFDDCIICPAYTGVYYVEFPKLRLSRLMK